MIRFQLGGFRPARVIEALERSLAGFLDLSMYQEVLAVLADMARVRISSRLEVIKLTTDTRQRLERRLPAKRLREMASCAELKNLIQVFENSGCHGAQGDDEHMKAAIVAFRESCGPKVLPCVMTTWR